MTAQLFVVPVTHSSVCDSCYSLLRSTEKFTFMDKRLHEISRFFVAPPRVFPLSVRARRRTFLSTNSSTSVKLYSGAKAVV